MFVWRCRVGSVSGGRGQGKWEGPLCYLPRDHQSHKQAARGRRRRRLKLAPLSGCHTARCARSQLGQRRLWGDPGRAVRSFRSFRSPQHPSDVSAALGLLRPPVRRRDSFPSFHHPGSTFRVSSHQSKGTQTARLINIHPPLPHLHKHTVCLIKITEAVAAAPISIWTRSRRKSETRYLTRKHDPTSLHRVLWADSMKKHAVTSSSLLCHQITPPIQFLFVSEAAGSGSDG